MANYILKAAKAWQGNDPLLVWQVALAGERPDADVPKKFYLVVDARQASFGARLTTIKPESLNPQGAFINLLRKYVRTAIIGEIARDERSGDIWLYLHTGAGEPSWYVKLSQSRPPELALVSREGEAIVRMSSKGSYTKRRALDEPMPSNDSPLVSLKPRLLEGLLKTEAAGSTGEAIENSPEDSSAEGRSKEQREVLARLRRRLKTLRKSRDKQSESIPDQGAIATLEQKAAMLQAYAYLVKPGAPMLALDPWQAGRDEPLEIELDPEASIGKNIEHYFSLVKKAKKSREMGLKQERRLAADIASLEGDVARLGSEAVGLGELEDICERYKLPLARPAPPARGEESSAKPYKIYKSAQGFDILVGKGPHENDELTKNAKANDYWLHVVGMTGSHVIIPAVRSIRDDLPADVQKEAAILALHFSKVRADFGGEVYFTRKSCLRKRKGMPAGLWSVERSETIFVRYDEAELQAIVGRLSV